MSTYSPPDSVAVERIQRALPSDELRERARTLNLVQRERKFDIVALFYTLSLGFAAESDRSLQAFLERYIEMADCEELSYASFHEWFEPGFVALLREILDDAVGMDELLLRTHFPGLDMDLAEKLLRTISAEVISHFE